MIDNQTLTENFERHSFDIGTLFLFENYVIAEMNEGVVLTFDSFFELGRKLVEKYNERPFGYIVHRKNSYSINPTDIHIFNKAFPNLKAFAVVSYSSMGEKIFTLENKFFNFNRQLFHDLKTAERWVQTTLKANSDVNLV
ncbi:hypothetical protein Q2T40_12050 [Winogradskyella maritima]|uniref:SpoIIAA-like protein n=1 Tax=Winogradskyella maritima TaxID=1517766 RepID=A0ABV8AKM5_9FLAO|nr:hypothetical protein [Winogradskyella maritima]